MTTLDGEQAFAWLLGELPEASSSALDEAVLGDDEVYALLQAFEAELFDAYLDGALSDERRRRFEQRFLSTPAGRERLRRAQALRRVAGGQPKAARESWVERLVDALTGPRLLVGGLVAAALAIIIAWPPGETVVRASLRPDALRAAAEPPRVELPSPSATLLLELALDGAAAQAWEASLSGPGGLVWKGAPLQADAVAARVKVSGVRWTPGRYRVDLRSSEETLEFVLELSVR